MLEIEGKAYEPVECLPESTCKGCAFEYKNCHKVNIEFDCTPQVGQWYIWKEVTEDGTRT
jgi:hypothetical protein